jgi:hypothetical protein
VSGAATADSVDPELAVGCPAMSALSKLSDWRLKYFLRIGLPLIAVIGLVFGSQDLVPAWQAKNGSGTLGTFTAQREDCGKRSCSFYGDFVGKDATTRTDVILYDEPDSLAVGGTTEAIDSGARKGVFATAGGSTYLLVTGLTLAGMAALIGWIVFLVRFFRGRKASAPATVAAAS